MDVVTKEKINQFIEGVVKLFPDLIIDSAKKLNIFLCKKKLAENSDGDSAAIWESCYQQINTC
jgi:hypothetical protein